MKYGLLVLTAIVLFGCSPSEESEGENLLKNQKEAMDKAEAVEDQLQEAADKRDQQLEEMEQ